MSNLSSSLISFDVVMWKTDFEMPPRKFSQRQDKTEAVNRSNSSIDSSVIMGLQKKDSKRVQEQIAETKAAAMIFNVVQIVSSHEIL